MAVYSMTGFANVGQSIGPLGASAEGSASTLGYLGVEIRSVNGRFLDLVFRMPEELRQAEPALREILGGQIKRGKVEMRVALELGGHGSLPEPSPRLLQKLNAMQDSVKAWLPGARELGVADVIRLCGLEQSPPPDLSKLLLNLARKALEELLAARQREGERLATTMLDCIAALRGLAVQAGPLVPQLVAQQRKRFLERWQEAMALTEGASLPEAAQDRALAEATAFAIRIDVVEELTRLNSHLDELERLLRKGGEMGKRLDFLIQELHREANTLGSKSAALELTHISVDMKVLIEQLREQVQNIE